MPWAKRLPFTHMKDKLLKEPPSWLSQSPSSGEVAILCSHRDGHEPTWKSEFDVEALETPHMSRICLGLCPIPAFSCVLLRSAAVPSVSHNQNPVSKWSTQNHASRIKKADIRSYLWQGDCPLLTFTYPGVEHVAPVEVACVCDIFREGSPAS